MRCPHQAHGHYDIGGSAIPVALYRSIPRLGSRETFALSIPRYRSGINRLRWMDRPTGRVIRRIETSRCGELVHIDVKKLARVPDGGGHKKLGRTLQPGTGQGGGYTHIHTAIDAYSRLAYTEFAGTENTTNCVAFLDRAVAWFADQGITIERILTDNGNGYRSFAGVTAAPSSASPTPAPSPTGPPRTAKSNASTAPSLDEWAYARLWRSEASRARALDRFLHRYNHHRHHTAIGGPPASRVNNLAGHNI